MVVRVAGGITQALIKEGLVRDDLEEWYRYAIVIVIEKSIVYLSILGLSVYLKEYISWILGNMTMKFYRQHLQNY